jgi:hypothetical protein
VVARPHHVRKSQKRGHQRIVFAVRQDDERSVRLRDTHRLALAAVDSVLTVPASVQARGVQPLAAEHAGAIRPQERRDDKVAGLHGAYFGADVLDDADELVAHAAASLARLHRLVRPQIAAADCGVGDADERVGRLGEASIGDVLDTNVAGAVHGSCAHGYLSPVFGGLQVVDGQGGRQITLGAGVWHVNLSSVIYLLH